MELTRRREFNQASPDESSCETRPPPLASNDLFDSPLVSVSIVGFKFQSDIKGRCDEVQVTGPAIGPHNPYSQYAGACLHPGDLVNLAVIPTVEDVMSVPSFVDNCGRLVQS